MSKQTDDESFPLILYPFLLVFTILFIVFTILTFGIFLPDEEKKKETQVKQKNRSVEERLLISKERKQHQLRGITARIHELQSIQQQIIKNERRVLFAVRLMIASGLVTLNYLYLKYTSDNPSAPICSLIDLDKIANLNTCILLLYGLPAYLLFGTIEKFTTAMKIKTTTILRRKHIPTFSELKLLKDKEIRLKNEIQYLEMQLEQFN
ncbi:hypothetical protein [Fluviicola sp.]|uniref:hypothetical protein n=1 Tax=Fluviicola sp. TaxID=1917219 RepID=UPI003D26F495